MAILYVITTTYSNSAYDTYPPQVLASDWMKQLNMKTAWIIREGNYVSDPEKNTDPGKNIRAFWFDSVSEFEEWANATRITDPEFIAAIKEWDSTHGISRSESYYELPSYTPPLTGLFSNLT